MSNLTHASYQDSSIPFVTTTRAKFFLNGLEVDSYNFQGVVCLSLEQGANGVNKKANSLNDFLKSNTLQAALVNKSSYRNTSFYTTDELRNGGKPARIVPLELVVLYWTQQAKIGNEDAFRLMAEYTFAKVAEDAKRSLGLLPSANTAEPLNALSMAKAYVAALEAEEKVNAFLSDKPIAKSVHESIQDASKSLPGFLSIREIGRYLELEFTSETGGALGTAVKGICVNYNFTTTKEHKHLVTRKGKTVFEKCNGYSVEILEHIPAILKQLGL